MARLRLFLDANIIVSGVVFEGAEALLLRAVRDKRYAPITSQYVIAQVRRVLRTKFPYTEVGANKAVAAIGLQVVPEPSRSLREEAEAVLRDPTDAPVLAAAWQAQVDALVTGDKDFFDSTTDLRVRAMTTTQALEWISERR